MSRPAGPHEAAEVLLELSRMRAGEVELQFKTLIVSEAQP
jgi:hypothetical protein